MSKIGDCLEKYELRKLLGSGGQGEVWQAIDTNLGRNVAIKILYPPWREDALKRFKREAMVLAALRHPHIVQVYDFFTPSSSESESLKACMVMEYIEGQTLEDYIKNTSHKGKFPSSQDILYLFTAIGSAIDAAHRERIIHRDIKPANILLDKRYTSRNAMGKPVLTDFGLVKLLGAPMGSSTRLGLGTPAYSSPEQARGSEGSKLSDIYSLGVILYEIYTGERPFQGGNNVAIIMQHIEGIFTPPMQLNPAISPELNAVISRSMDKNPENRFLSAFAMTSALANALQLPIPKYPSVPDYSQNIDVEDRPTPLDSLLDEKEYSSYVPTPASENIAKSSFPAHVAQQPPNSVASQPPVQPPSAPQRASRRQPRNMLIVLTFLVLVALIIVAALGWTSLFPRGNINASNGVVGHAFFSNNLDMNDTIQINLQNIPAPASGKSYYAWLSAPASSGESAFWVRVGKLTLKNGIWGLPAPYTDASNRNLLQLYNRFLITQEDNANVPPIQPSNISSYSAQFSSTTGSDGYSLWRHLQHLLSDDPDLDKLKLKGGLDFYLNQNVGAILKWALTARDHWTGDVNDLPRIMNIRSLIVDILYYLDGPCTAQNDLALLPTGIKAQAKPDVPLIANTPIGLLDCSQQRGYLSHIDFHLTGVSMAKGVTPDQSKLAPQIKQYISDLNNWLGNIRLDATRLVSMNILNSNTSARSLLQDMAVWAGYAYGGQVDPVRGLQPGAAEIYGYIQQLATFDVASCSSPSSCVMQ